ncbi:hypothetical protein ACHAXR_010884 [Thalassiosira sp. AJA248-18]
MTIPHPSATAAAFLSTGLISLVPNILLFIFPNYGASGHNDNGRAILSLGQALAVGGLIGDVFLHTLPDCYVESIGGNNHEDHHHHHDIGLLVILGFSVFLMLDVIVRTLEEKSGGGHNHGHDHSNSRNGERETNKSSKKLLLSSAVLLNLLGDSLHNFTDGLAIGATFSVAQIPHTHSESSFISWTASVFSLLKSRGGLASISVLLHEIPHELGDFATLVKAGLTRNMAIGAQFLTAIAAFLGTAFGLYSGQIIEGLGHDVLLPFTAGGFLYLACSTILPDVLETDASALQRMCQIIAFLLGVAFMYAVAELEEMEASNGGHDHHHHHHGHHSSNGHSHSEL